ncbi:MAG: hypothetical protein MZW92_63980 [Comamonadaceae bacterium]|nr:hypothetical protein [Comamonadaceae bacterium]
MQLKQANRAASCRRRRPQACWSTNPPYGVRLGEQDELAAFYPRLGDALKQRFAGWRCYFFSGDTRPAEADRPARRQRIAALQRRAGVPALRVPHGGGNGEADVGRATPAKHLRRPGPSYEPLKAR